MRESKTFVDWNGVRDSIARIKNDTSGATGGVEREDCLYGDIECGGVESFEHDLRHFLAISLGVEGSLCEENWVLLGSNTQLIVECVMPDLLHVIPVCNDTVLDGVLEGKNTPL